MLAAIEQSRITVSKQIHPKNKSRLGQFFTSARIARFMAGLFIEREIDNYRLLDAGAGIGSLSAAFLDRFLSARIPFNKFEIDAFEIDEFLCSHLTKNLDEYRKSLSITLNVRCEDFIHSASGWISGDLFAEPLPKYTHAILNPPYKKIRSDSRHRSELRRAGIETVNLYSSFVALSLALLEHQGQLVAIIPRSFCNGLYYRPFREFVLNRSAIHQIHLFESRNKAFKDDNVLQENIIILLERGGKQGAVKISTSADDNFKNLNIKQHPYNRIIYPNDPEKFIHIPTSTERNILESSPKIHYSTSEIGVKVSTGPVVEFRVKEYLRKKPESGTVPLLYPNHFRNFRPFWPQMETKKPNAIQLDLKTKKWLYPNGFYCVVRRFSSKEEKRRIVASVVDPDCFPKAHMLGFENHLNLFHNDKHGLPSSLAYGLAVFLNTTAVDEFFRSFNGHTQVNATDLKRMQYPSRNVLITLGEWAMRQSELTQEKIDNKFETICHEK